MPYKDPERKRQWEREHREQRNARRRERAINGALDLSNVDAPVLDPNSAQELGSPKMIVSLVVGFAFVVVLLFAGWRFRSCPN